MNYSIAVFRSRTETMSFSNILKSYGIPISIVSTPRTLNVSCGISVKFPTVFTQTAKDILQRRKFNTFAGIHKYNFQN